MIDWSHYCTRPDSNDQKIDPCLRNVILGSSAGLCVLASPTGRGTTLPRWRFQGTVSEKYLFVPCLYYCFMFVCYHVYNTLLLCDCDRGRGSEKQLLVECVGSGYIQYVHLIIQFTVSGLFIPFNHSLLLPLSLFADTHFSVDTLVLITSVVRTQDA